jgi:hypothetical protein
VVFLYTAGFTDDVQYHFHLFAIPARATWRVESKGG